MKPVIEPIKSDPKINENFEQIQSVLCGNVSLDNFRLRILEGTTKESDTENLVNHSGNTRPVGWLPLVGDVYVQEISEKYIDIRSTKPDVNYKILILFGTAITSESLKAIGGDGYKNTTKVIETTQVLEQTTIIDQTVKMVPTIAHGTALENPTNATCDVPLRQVSHMVSNDGYLFLTEYSTATNSCKNVRRVNLTTLTVDLLYIAAATAFGAMVIDGNTLYVFEAASIANTVYIYVIDIPSWTHTGTISGTADNIIRITDVYYDTATSIFYFTGANGLATAERLLKMPLAGGVGSITALTLGGAGTGMQAKEIIPYGTDLYIMGDKTNTDTLNIYKVDKGAFAVTTTYTTAAQRWSGGAALLYNNNYIVFPVMYNVSRTLTVAAGTVPFGLCILNLTDSTFKVSPAPMFTPVTGEWILNIVEQDDYFYMIQSSDAGGYTGGITAVCRFDAINEVWEYGVFPFSTAAQSANTNQLRNNLHKFNDGTIWVVSSGLGQYSCLQAFEIDFSQYVREE